MITNFFGYSQPAKIQGRKKRKRNGGVLVVDIANTTILAKLWLSASETPRLPLRIKARALSLRNITGNNPGE